MTARLERATAALRQAEIALAAAMERCEEASSEFSEARLMEEPRFSTWPHDPRSVAERYRDGEVARVERSDAP